MHTLMSARTHLLGKSVLFSNMYNSSIFLINSDFMPLLLKESSESKISVTLYLICTFKSCIVTKCLFKLENILKS